MTIIGAGAPTTIIDGNGIDRVFDVAAKADIREVTIRNGNAGTTTCPSGIGPVGGAIYSAPGTVAAGVTLTGVAIMQNTATHGGGIENDLGSSLDLNGVTVSANTASIAGGGIENLAGALPKPVDPQLAHFVQRKSYDKAHELLEGRAPSRP